jgi:hypothetical protein
MGTRAAYICRNGQVIVVTYLGTAESRQELLCRFPATYSSGPKVTMPL